MLQSLKITNFVIIEEAFFEFDSGFHVFSGDTGSGKSLLFNAILFVLGKRMNPVPIGSFQDSASVQLSLRIEGQDLRIHREIFSNGKSQLRINDKPVSIKKLKEILRGYIEIIEQEDTPSYDNSYLTQCIDVYGSIDLGAYQMEYQKLTKLEKTLSERHKVHQKHLNYKLRHNELNELKRLQPCFNEFETIEAQLKDMDQIRHNTTLLEAIHELLQNRQFCHTMTKLGTSIESLNRPELKNELLQVQLSLECIQELITDDIMKLKIDHAQEKLENRLKEYLPYIKRYGGLKQLCHTYQEFLEYESSVIDYGSDCNRLQNQIQVQLVSLDNMGKQISIQRVNTLPVLINDLISVLKELNLGQIDVQLKHRNTSAHQLGLDLFDLEVNLNQQDTLVDFKQTASGGEKSRFHLALLYCLAVKRNTKVYLFDEIDTGVSGSVSGAMGSVFSKLAQHAQVFLITHQAPIAAYAKTHFGIHKVNNGTKVISKSNRLLNKERVEALALMMAGNTSVQSCEVAQQLLKKGAL